MACHSHLIIIFVKKLSECLLCCFVVKFIGLSVSYCIKLSWMPAVLSTLDFLAHCTIA